MPTQWALLRKAAGSILRSLAMSRVLLSCAQRRRLRRVRLRAAASGAVDRMPVPVPVVGSVKSLVRIFLTGFEPLLSYFF